MSSFTLNASYRSQDFGRRASRRLRAKFGHIPSIIYGLSEKVSHITISHKDIEKALSKGSFYSHVLHLNMDNGDEHQVVLKAVQRHPWQKRILHVDFLRVSADQKLQVSVPIRYLNESIAPGVKNDGGIVFHIKTSADIRCLPKDLPEFIEVDLSQLKLDETIHLSQIKVAPGIEFVDILHGNDAAIVNIQLPRSVVADDASAETAVAAGAVPASNQKDPSEIKAKENKQKDKK